VIAGFLARLLINAVAIYLTTRILPGIRVPDVPSALVAALVLGLVNAFIRPVVLLLTLPLNILTLGLFTLVVNALMLYLVAAVVPKFEIANFLSALVGALLIAVISTLLSHLFRA
jgi:putative membrane protein